MMEAEAVQILRQMRENLTGAKGRLRLHRRALDVVLGLLVWRSPIFGSELDLIKGIATRAVEAHDQIMEGLNKSQRTPRLEREMRDQRERLAVLVQCAIDALTVHVPKGES